MATEQDRKEKAPVPAEVWAAVVRAGEKVAVKDAAAEKAVVVARAREKGKGVARGKDKAANKTSELHPRTRGTSRCQVEIEQAPRGWAR